jgi:pSer/pThr/pTyr-binding forkhead associated (FHA) protein
MIRVTVTEPGLSARVSRFSQTIIAIGRDGQNDVVLREPSVSAHHGRLRIADDMLMYDDLLSTNGSLVRRSGVLLRVDQRCLHQIQLERQDELLFGPPGQPTVLRVVLARPREQFPSPMASRELPWDGWPRR